MYTGRQDHQNRKKEKSETLQEDRSIMKFRLYVVHSFAKKFRNLFFFGLSRYGMGCGEIEEGKVTQANRSKVEAKR